MTAQKVSAAHSLHSEIEAARVLLATYPDIFGDDAVARADAVEGETNLREAIGIGLARIIELEAMEDAIGIVEDNLKARKARFAVQKENLRTSLTVALELAELPGNKMETPLATIALQRVPPRLAITDEAAIPSKFWKAQEPKLDKAAIKSALKDKELVPGAQLDNGSVTCQIRPR